LIAVAIGVALIGAWPPAVAADAPGGDCSAARILDAQSALDRSLRGLLASQSWLQSGTILCTGLANGSATEQAQSITSCLAVACARGRQGACAAVPQIAGQIHANAASRRDEHAVWQRCAHVPGFVATSDDPLRSYLSYELASGQGDERAARQLTAGTDAEFATAAAELSATRAAGDFYDAAAASYGVDAAELARLVFATNSRPAPANVEGLRVDVSGDKALIDRVTPMRREGGVWKLDLTLINTLYNADSANLFRLSAYSWQMGADYMRAHRAVPPAASAAVMQCMTTAQALLSRSLQAAEGMCESLFGQRFPTAIPQKPAGNGTGRTASRAVEAAIVERAVDSSFRAWSRSWFRDRYVLNSARVAGTQCSDSGCESSGSFDFTRGTARLTIPFTASLSVDAAGAVAVEHLCYDDTTTGMSDCAD
jgi:hypothetical protein